MYRIVNILVVIQEMFKLSEGNYNLRGWPTTERMIVNINVCRCREWNYGMDSMMDSNYVIPF